MTALLKGKIPHTLSAYLHTQFIQNTYIVVFWSKMIGGRIIILVGYCGELLF